MSIVEIVKSRNINADIMVSSIIRNEMLCLPDWFEHYRALGVTKFVVLDDNSTDGSTDFLAEQPDCILLKSQYHYGSIINGQAFYITIINTIPEMFAPKNSWVITVDGDELICLPPGFKTFNAYLKQLPRPVNVIDSLMVDFYPKSIRDLYTTTAKGTLFERYPYYDNLTHIGLRRTKGPKLIYGGPRGRLFKQYGINMEDPYIFKQPITRWTQNNRYKTSHIVHSGRSSQRVLPMAHFKFTSSLPEKIDHAIKTKVHWHNSIEYFAYQSLLERMKENKDDFLCQDSAILTNTDQLFKSKLMRNNLYIHTRKLAYDFAKRLKYKLKPLDNTNAFSEISKK